MLKIFGEEKISRADALLCVFIAVNGCDSAKGRAVLFAGKTCLLKLVKSYMVRHCYYRTVAYLEICRPDLDPGAAKALDLSVKMLQINSHAVSHNAHDVRAGNARRKQIKYKLSAIVHHGMAGIVSALITNNDILALTEKIDDSAFTLVSPIYSDYSC